MMTTKEQRAMMAAHLLDIIARAMRANGMSPTTREAHARAELIMLDDPESERWYRSVLAMFGASPADIDAACEAIARGGHPADSLPGRIELMRATAEDGAEATEVGTVAHHVHRALEDAACAVLDLLGCHRPARS